MKYASTLLDRKRRTNYQNYSIALHKDVVTLGWLGAFRQNQGNLKSHILKYQLICAICLIGIILIKGFK